MCKNPTGLSIGIRYEYFCSLRTCTCTIQWSLLSIHTYRRRRVLEYVVPGDGLCADLSARLAPSVGLAAAVRSCEAPRLLHGSSLLIKEARCADTVEQHPCNSPEYKQNLPMDNTRAFVIFQNPTYPPPRRTRIRRCALSVSLSLARVAGNFQRCTRVRRL